MRFLVAAIVAVLLLTIFYRPLKRFPLVFYTAALILDGLYAYAATQLLTGVFWTNFIHLMQRSTLAFILFSSVMFIGVLDEGSGLRTRLLPIRRQLSILACLLAFCHIIYYIVSYLPRLTGVFRPNVLISIGLALCLAAVMVALFITSFTRIKARMSASGWKRIQKLSYPFYLVIYVHLALFLLPAASIGKDTAIVSFVIYTVVVLAYVVLRIRKKILDDKLQRAQAAAESAVSSD